MSRRIRVRVRMRLRVRVGEGGGEGEGMGKSEGGVGGEDEGEGEGEDEGVGEDECEYEGEGVGEGEGKGEGKAEGEVEDEGEAEGEGKGESEAEAEGEGVSKRGSVGKGEVWVRVCREVVEEARCGVKEVCKILEANGDPPTQPCPLLSNGDVCDQPHQLDSRTVSNFQVSHGHTATKSLLTLCNSDRSIFGL